MKSSLSRYTGGCWSPARMSVFYTIRQDGVLEVWDILYNHRGPYQEAKIADHPLYALKLNPNGKMIALGAGDGSTIIASFAEELLDNNKIERGNTNDMLER